MLTVILLLLAALSFLAAAINETIVSQPPADLVAWGLFFVAVALLFGSPWIVRRFNPGGE